MSGSDPLTFRIKRTAKFSKVFGAYAERRAVDRSALRLIYDGAVIKDNDTPESLQMEPEKDGVAIEATLTQTGGM